MRGDRYGLAVLVVATCAACATNPAPPMPASLAHPEFVYPAVPAGLADAAAGDRIERGWRLLQADDLRNADREFSVAIERIPGLFPARTGLGYVALARRDAPAAVAAFEDALGTAPAYVPALVGRGQALLALGRDADALTAFEAALAVDPALAELRQRVDVLRFRRLQDLIEAARAAAAAGRAADAVRAYEAAAAASPESAFLHRELGLVERRQGNGDAALRHLRRAVELEPEDAAALIEVGELLEEGQDFAGAEAAYRRAADLDPGPRVTGRLAAVIERARDARLPAEFRAIPAAAQISRGALAALIAVRLDRVVQSAPVREVVVTDTAGHWAAPWIAQVARAGIIEPFANHTFQPSTAVTRGELASAVRGVVALVARERPDLQAALAGRPDIADMTSNHLSYPAASVAVASGVLPLLAGGRFDVGRAVSGAEAAEAVGRLRAFVDGPR